MKPKLYRPVLNERERAQPSLDVTLAARIFGAKEAGYKAVNPQTDHFIGFQEATIDLEAPDGNVSAFDIRYHGTHARSRVLHNGRGISVLHDSVCTSLFVIPAIE